MVDYLIVQYDTWGLIYDFKVYTVIDLTNAIETQFLKNTHGRSLMEFFVNSDI